MGLYKRGEIYWFNITVDGEQICRSTKTKDLKLATKIWHKVDTAVTENTWFDLDQSRRHSYDELKKKFQHDYAPRKKPNTQAMYTRSFQHLDHYFLGRNLAQINVASVTHMMADRVMEQGALPATMNREFSTLSRALSFAKDLKWVKYNVCIGIEKWDENNIKEMWLTHDQEAVLLFNSWAFLDGNLPDMELVGIHAGFREGEILPMQASQVNLPNRTVTALDTKNGDPRTVPMNDTLYRMFARRMEGLAPHDNVFSAPDGQPYSARALQKEFKVALGEADKAEAGIPDFFTFHGTRHTFGTRLAAAGKNSRQIGELMGIKSEKILRRYTHLSVEHLRDIVSDLERSRDEER